MAFDRTAWRREYEKRPEFIAKRKAYLADPETKAKRKAYHAAPKQRAKEKVSKAIHRGTPEYKERNKLYTKQYYDKLRERVNTMAIDEVKEKVRSRMLAGAKYRSKVGNLPFNIDKEDIVFGDCCPLLGTSFVFVFFASNSKAANRASPSLDRIDPAKGYVKGNVWVISYKANTMKNNFSFEEFTLMAENWRKQRESLQTQENVHDSVGLPPTGGTND